MGATVQGQRYRRYHRLSAGFADGCPAARGRSLRLLRQGGEIPVGRPAVRRLYFLRLPLGALWRRRTAAAQQLLNRTIPAEVILGGKRRLVRKNASKRHARLGALRIPSRCWRSLPTGAS